ncbi:b56e4188-8b5e-4227-84cb-f6daed23db25 [Sclerotinia trifoliorum]|uniref:B56e4188-8b5e-4227-84cb-f6daed23db25 n=1 Tax=Sclerotinia trifoliorum TaxID=28548 RepID=A0A8H2ZQ64_9HELO|nr:b56e4188-8b5e-4227-84cb-f6daed23db25 [Sclerotinia trifoliorum]
MVSEMSSDEFEMVDSADISKQMLADEKPDLASIKAWLNPTDYLASSSEFNRHFSSKSPETDEWIRKTSQFNRWHSSVDHGSIWIEAVPEEELVKRDISVFVQQRVMEFEMDGIDESMQIFIEKTVCERSQGLFLYARLMLDEIGHSTKEKNYKEASIREMITDCPQALRRCIQVIILQLVTQSARPMRLIEIGKAIEDNPHVIRSGKDSKDIVRSSCGPVLEIMEDGVVQILHHSFTEFLLGVGRTTSTTSDFPQFPFIDPKNAHREIAITCISQLQGVAFSADSMRLGAPRPVAGRSMQQEFDFCQLFIQYPLLEYAATEWTYHAKRHEYEDPSFYEKLEEFCNHENRAFKAWCTLVGKSRYSTDVGAAPNIDGYDGLKPLHVAASNNHAGVVKLLLRAGVSPLTPKTKDVNMGRSLIEMIPYCETKDLERSLLQSAYHGHHALVSSLLERKDVSPNAKAPLGNGDMSKIGGQTALMVATSSLELRSVKVLLENGAIASLTGTSKKDVPAPPTKRRVNLFKLEGRTPLHNLAIAAAREEDQAAAKEILDMLLLAGADFEARDDNGDTPLLLAVVTVPLAAVYGSSKFCQNSMELLLSASANPCAMSSSAFGANPNQARISSRLTPLHCATDNYNMHKPIEHIELLVSHGADINTQDTKGNTPLHRADSMNGNSLLREVAGLFDGGSGNVALIEYRQQTAVHIMGPVKSYSGSSRNITNRGTFISIILRLWPDFDVNMKDIEGYTPFHYACATSESSAFVLVKAGADLDVKTFNGHTPLHCAARRRQCGIISMLLSQAQNSGSTIDLNARDSKGMTPLHYACISGRSESILLNAGASTESALSLALNAKCIELIHAIREKESTKSKTFAEIQLMAPIENIPELDEITMDHMVARGFDFTKEVIYNYVCLGPPIVRLAYYGMTEVMNKILSSAKLFDDPKFTGAIADSRPFKFDGWRGIRPLLQVACQRPIWNMDMVKLLVEEGHVDVNAHQVIEESKNGTKTENEVQGTAALHILAEGNFWWQIEAIRYLGEHGAEVDILDENGRTSLEIASTYSEHGSKIGRKFFRPQCCEALLKLGANPNKTNREGLTALNKARSDKDTVQILLKYGADVNTGTKSVFATAIESGDIEMLQLYLQNGADPNGPDHSTDSSFRAQHETVNVAREYPIVMAALLNDYKDYSASTTAEMVNLLLDHGARVDLPIDQQRTVLHYLFANATSASLRPFFEISGIYMNRGADPLEPDPKSDTALHHLSRKLPSMPPDRHLPSMNRFIALGGSINARNDMGMTPLLAYLQVRGDQSNLPWFKEHGADFKIKNNEGEGALHIVAKRKAGKSQLLI